MPIEEEKTFLIEDAELTFRNFAGKEGLYNRPGVRSFGVRLPEDVAEEMLRDGWNVKYSNPNDEEGEAKPYIAVGVRFDIRPPRIILLTETTRTQLHEDSVEVLDWAKIKNVDLIARGRYWEQPSGKSGTKAYLQSLFVTIEEDYLEKKYAINENPPT